MYLSIIIPAFNESSKISVDIYAADKFLTENNFIGEIIVVDDGSTDDTSEIAQSLKNEINANLNVIRLAKNIGKGAAVREGVLLSSGKIVMFADAGNTVPFENALVGIKMIEDGKCDIANGSRKLFESEIKIEQEFNRKVFSGIFSFFTKKFLHIPQSFTDTQCGFKIYKNETAKIIFNKMNISGFLFEIEFIIIALNLGYKILEFPITWKCDVDSRISVGKSSKKIISEFIFLLKKYKN